MRDNRIVKVKIPCYVDGRKTMIDVYIGSPKDQSNPLGFQNKMLSQRKGAVIPQDILDSFAKLSELSRQYGVSLQDLCIEAFNSMGDTGSDLVS